MELSEDKLFELEERKHSLEEKRETNRAEEAKLAHELALVESGSSVSKPHYEAASQVSVALIAVLSAMFGGMASLGGAYVTGVFDVEKSTVAAQGQFDLEKQKFANNLINSALNERSDRERALRLQFMVDVGLFDAELKPEVIGEYTTAETERIKHGGKGESLLPRTSRWDPISVDEFFTSNAPGVSIFGDEAGILILREAGALRTREGLALILANLHYETSGFTLFEENGNYSAARLRLVWSQIYKDANDATRDAHNPEAILNRVYKGRLGNKDINDGWNYRGRGFIQLTGRDNYDAMGKALNMDLLGQPELALLPANALRIAMAYFESRGLIDVLHQNDVKRFRRMLHGSTVGLTQIQILQASYLEAFTQSRYENHPLVKALP